jgi:hypothetical protein
MLMQKWEYLAFVSPVKESPKDEHFLGYSLRQMKDAGQEGWELVTVIYTVESLVYYYKRPIPPPEPPERLTTDAAPRVADPHL